MKEKYIIGIAIALFSIVFISLVISINPNKYVVSDKFVCTKYECVAKTDVDDYQINQEIAEANGFVKVPLPSGYINSETTYALYQGPVFKYHHQNYCQLILITQRQEREPQGEISYKIDDDCYVERNDPTSYQQHGCFWFQKSENICVGGDRYKRIKIKKIPDEYHRFIESFSTKDKK